MIAEAPVAPSQFELYLKVIIGALATGFAVYKAVFMFLRHQLRNHVSHTDTSRLTAHPEKRNDNPLDLSSETAQFFVKILQPEIENKQKEYGRRLDDLRTIVADHLVKAEPYMARVHVLENSIQNMQRQQEIDKREMQRQQEMDKREILAAVNQSEGRISGRLSELNTVLANGRKS